MTASRKPCRRSPPGQPGEKLIEANQEATELLLERYDGCWPGRLGRRPGPHHQLHRLRASGAQRLRGGEPVPGGRAWRAGEEVRGTRPGALRERHPVGGGGVQGVGAGGCDGDCRRSTPPLRQPAAGGGSGRGQRATVLDESVRGCHHGLAGSGRHDHLGPGALPRMEGHCSGRQGGRGGGARQEARRADWSGAIGGRHVATRGAARPRPPFHRVRATTASDDQEGRPLPAVPGGGARPRPSSQRRHSCAGWRGRPAGRTDLAYAGFRQVAHDGVPGSGDTVGRGPSAVQGRGRHRPHRLAAPTPRYGTTHGRERPGGAETRPR